MQRSEKKACMNVSFKMKLWKQCKIGRIQCWKQCNALTNFIADILHYIASNQGVTSCFLWHHKPLLFLPGSISWSDWLIENGFKQGLNQRNVGGCGRRREKALERDEWLIWVLVHIGAVIWRYVTLSRNGTKLCRQWPQWIQGSSHSLRHSGLTFQNLSFWSRPCACSVWIYVHCCMKWV